MEKISQRRILAPVVLLKKARRHVCADTSMQGHIPSRSVQTRSSEWEHIPLAENHMSTSGGGILSSWQTDVGTAFAWGTPPSTGVSSAAPSGKIPSLERMDG